MIKNNYNSSAAKGIQPKKPVDSSKNSAPENNTQPLFTAEQNNNIEKSAYSDIYEKADGADIAEKYNQFLAKYVINQGNKGCGGLLDGIISVLKGAAGTFSDGLKTAPENLYSFIKNYDAYMNNGSADGIQDGLSKNSPLEYSDNYISSKYDALIKQFGIEVPEIQNTLINTETASVSENKYKVPGFYNDEAGKKLAKTARHTAGTIGYCLRGVNKTLNKVYGQKIEAKSAYMAADILASNDGIGKYFTEDAVPRNFLETLPEGAVVVWDNNADGGGSNVTPRGRKHGHISIALGNGMESSDHIAKQIVGRDAEFRVFYPNS